MSYEGAGRKALDYELCQYGGSKLLFRGPKVDLNTQHIAFLGGTETFGKFIPAPFPHLVAGHLNKGGLNLGQCNAGVDVYLNDPGVLDVAARADVRVVQVMGAVNVSNRYFAVHPRRNDRFIGAHDVLKSLYPEIDFTDFHFTRHLLGALRAHSDRRFEMVMKELQDTWLARMVLLLKILGPRTVLLWFSHRTPRQDAEATLVDPLYIDADMLAHLRKVGCMFIEVIADLGDDGPQSADSDHLELFAPSMHAAALSVLPPKAHFLAAQSLQEPLEYLFAR